MKKIWPAAERNKQPILDQLVGVLPARGLVLEIASGTGQHAAFFAAALPGLTWQPTDLDPENLASIAAYRDESGAPNLRPPIPLDVTAPWPIEAADAMYVANLVHIAPWEVALALLAGAARVLPAGAPLVLYGPYRRDDVPFAPSNEAFDADLRARDPRWGVRRLEDVTAAAVGFRLDRVVEMPANNVLVVLRRA